ncbi:hypothetical protein F5J12DRAFT_897710 [Pisolithus orientalis]|uniref:uncharacterized protein n=1 Tax=Pisolithus orientalis TaxID=936130 RepID=UPI00222552EE|nr:uncharacterized protein F5J12DRAFT_897710 [Pisolithus orientalis]KAI5990565.1 hypothetical protein F5J12DRAFT_897710 [Pisolithus orientalis]
MTSASKLSTSFHPWHTVRKQRYPVYSVPTPTKRSFVHSTSPHALGTPQLKAALSGGLRVLASSMADVVGPSQGPMGMYTSEHRAEAKVALSFLFEYECLDVYLPLLEDSSL